MPETDYDDYDDFNDFDFSDLIDGPLFKGVEGEMLVPVRQAFVIDSDERANWLLGKLLAIDEQTAILKRQFEDMQGGLARERERLMLHFGPQLRQYALQKLGVASEMDLAGKKGKTAKFLLGNASFTTVGAKTIIRPGMEEEVFAWARTCLPDAIKTTVPEPVTKLDKAEVIRYFEMTGDGDIPGIERVPASEKFDIKFPKPPKSGDTLGTKGEESL